MQCNAAAYVCGFGQRSVLAVCEVFGNGIKTKGRKWQECAIGSRRFAERNLRTARSSFELELHVEASNRFSTFATSFAHRCRMRAGNDFQLKAGHKSARQASDDLDFWKTGSEGCVPRLQCYYQGFCRKGDEWMATRLLQKFPQSFYSS